MVCTECGFENIEGVRFCMKCGHKLFDEVPEEEVVEETQEETQEANPEAESDIQGSIAEPVTEVAETKKGKKEKKKFSFFKRKKDTPVEAIAEEPVVEVPVIGEPIVEVPVGEEPASEVPKNILQDFNEQETGVQEIPTKTYVFNEVTEGMPQEESVQPVEDIVSIGTSVEEPKEEEQREILIDLPLKPMADPAKKSSSAAKLVLGGVVASALLCGAAGCGYLYYINTPEYKSRSAIKEADEFMENKQYTEAIDSYLKANEYVEMDPATQKSLYNAYMELAKEDATRGDLDSALAGLELASNYVSEQTEIKEAKQKMMLDKASQEMQLGKYEDALSYFDKAVEYGASQQLVEKDKQGIFGKLGEEAYGKGNYKDASMYYEKAYEMGAGYEPVADAYTKYYFEQAQNAFNVDDVESAAESLTLGYEYLEKEEDRILYEQLTEAVSEKRRTLRAESLGYVIQTDNEGNVYDLGGMEIIVSNWWGDEAKEEEYLEWIQDTYNFKIRTEKSYEWDRAVVTLREIANAGSEANYIMTVYDSPQLARLMEQGKLYNLSTLDCLNFENAKFHRNEVSNIYSDENGIYGMNSSFSEPRGGVYFNKRLLMEAGIDPDSIYDMQADKTWTWDKWQEVMTQVQNNTGAMGCVQNKENLITAAVFSNGGCFIDKNENGYVSMIESDETKEALKFSMNIMKKYSVRLSDDAAYNAYQSSFLRGEAAFMVDDGYVGLPGGFLMDMEDEYGFVCFPMGPKMTEYRTYKADNVVVIPASYDADRAWKIAFAWNLYTEPVNGYESIDINSKRYKNDFCDERARTETIPIMSANGVIGYDAVVSGVDRNKDLITFIEPDIKLNTTLKNLRKTWNNAVEEANER